MTRALRVATGVVGVLAAAYGVWLLLGIGWANTAATATWLVGGVVLRTGTVLAQIGSERLRVGGKQLPELCDAVRIGAVETRRDRLPEQ